jgi:hypothetical protein
MYNYDSSSPQIRNSLIWGNGSNNVYNNSSPTPSYTYSLVEGLAPSGSEDGGNNMNGTNTLNDPMFVDPVDPASAPTPTGDYHLQSNSPVINKGSNSLYPANASDIEALLGTSLSATAKAAINAALQKDAGGDNRFNSTIDMGAYER